MIVNHLENCIKALQAEKQAQINVATDKAIREIVIPHNNEQDNKRNLAIQELQAKRDEQIRLINEQIKATNDKFEKDKQLLIAMGEEEKAKFKEQTIASETALVAIAYDSAINDLNKQMEKFVNKE